MEHTLFLLTTAHSYRARPFQEAAERLAINLITVVDMPAALAAQWGYPLGLDFKDSERAVPALVALAREHRPRAILAVDDAGSLLAARASAQLGLPHNDPAAAAAARDKQTMRTMLAATDVLSPRFWPFTTAADPAEIARVVSYPCVVKPTTRAGSQGVIRANNPPELLAAIARLSHLLSHGAPTPGPQPFLVEQYIPGVEVALEGLLDHGRLHVLALFDKPDPLEGPFFEETIYVTPSRLPEHTQAAIVKCASRAARALGLRHGPLHAELRINQQGVWVVEVAGRSIGGLCAQTLRFGVDASLEELILRQAAGLEWETLDREQAARGVMMIPIPAGGLLRNVTGLEAALAVPHVEEVEITAQPNQLITPLPEGDSYLGFIFARATHPAEVEAALRQAHARLHFEIEPVLALRPLLPTA